MTRSNLLVTDCTWLYAKCAQTDNLPGSFYKGLEVVTILIIFIIGSAFDYHFSCTLISQAFFACGQLLQNKQRKYFIVPCVLLSIFAGRNMIVNRTTKLKRAPRRVTFQHSDLHHILKSQSGQRSYMQSDKDRDLPVSNQSADMKTDSPVSIVVHAGAHHSVRMRASKPSDDPWSMNKIYFDSNTLQSDLKYIKTKFVEEQRNHFAAQGDALCDSTQITPTQALMEEMKISIPSSDGMSSQEVVQATSSEASDDIVV